MIIFLVEFISFLKFLGQKNLFALRLLKNCNWTYNVAKSEAYFKYHGSFQMITTNLNFKLGTEFATIVFNRFLDVLLSY